MSDYNWKCVKKGEKVGNLGLMGELRSPILVRLTRMLDDRKKHAGEWAQIVSLAINARTRSHDRCSRHQQAPQELHPLHLKVPHQR